MPNWIINSVSVEGNEEQIKTLFKKHFRGETIDFETIIPTPKTQEECPKKYICNPEEAHIQSSDGQEWFNWYCWNYDNWGVKWNACEGYVEENYFQFDTPWSCPMPIFEKLSKLYPEIEFMVDVDGETDEPYGFTIKNGVVR